MAQPRKPLLGAIAPPCDLRTRPGSLVSGLTAKGGGVVQGTGLLLTRDDRESESPPLFCLKILIPLVKG